MPTKTIELREAVEFVEENGYLLAVYAKNQNNYELVLNSYEGEIVSEDTKILVNISGGNNGQTDFNEFVTEDKQFMFVLHNNFNIPKVIPAK